MTLALALVANIAWLYLILKYAGVKVIMKDLFGNKARKGEVPTIMFLLLGVIFIAVGFIEIFIHLVSPGIANLPSFRKCFWWRKPPSQYAPPRSSNKLALTSPFLLHGSFDRFGSSFSLYVTRVRLHRLDLQPRWGRTSLIFWSWLYEKCRRSHNPLINQHIIKWSKY